MLLSRIFKKQIAVMFAAALLLAGSAFAQNNEIAHWNRIATDASLAAQVDPLAESRIFAILHLAIHDAVNSIERRYEPYRFQSQTSGEVAIPAVIAAAAHAVLSELIPAAKPQLDAAFEETLRAIPNADAKTNGLETGRKAALAILAARKNDGANRKVERAPGIKLGEYRPTPPDFTPAMFVQWGDITPFVLKSSAQFRPVPPPKVTSERALADLEEVKAIGAAKSAIRTEEQSEIARFWYESSPQGWNRIAREVAVSQQLDSWESARFFALVNLAMADGFIGGFEAKYHYNYWRPATALRATSDSSWMNYLWTPPVPDYPSTHTVLGAAAATAMAKFFGTDYIDFTMTSGVPYPGITRKFWSFSEAARENGASRVFAGIHFSTAVSAGYLQGAQIGEWVFENALRPLQAADKAPLSSNSAESYR